MNLYGNYFGVNGTDAWGEMSPKPTPDIDPDMVVPPDYVPDMPIFDPKKKRKTSGYERKGSCDIICSFKKSEIICDEDLGKIKVCTYNGYYSKTYGCPEGTFDVCDYIHGSQMIDIIDPDKTCIKGSRVMRIDNATCVKGNRYNI